MRKGAVYSRSHLWISNLFAGIRIAQDTDKLIKGDLSKLIHPLAGADPRSTAKQVGLACRNGGACQQVNILNGLILLINGYPFQER